MISPDPWTCFGGDQGCLCFVAFSHFYMYVLLELLVIVFFATSIGFCSQSVGCSWLRCHHGSRFVAFMFQEEEVFKAVMTKDMNTSFSQTKYCRTGVVYASCVTFFRLPVVTTFLMI